MIDRELFFEINANNINSASPELLQGTLVVQKFSDLFYEDGGEFFPRYNYDQIPTCLGASDSKEGRKFIIVIDSDQLELNSLDQAQAAVKNAKFFDGLIFGEGAYAKTMDFCRLRPDFRVIENSPLPLMQPVAAIPRPHIFWLITSRYLTTLMALSGFLSFEEVKNKHTRELKQSGTAEFPYPAPGTFKQAIFKDLAKCFREAIGFDGYDSVANTITSADGYTTKYTGQPLPFWLSFASFLGLPSRPECVVNGVPQFSGWQLLRNLFGVWYPIKETITNREGNLSFHQKRWTEKKTFQTLVVLFKIFIIFPLKLLTLPFKLMLNILKLFTEVLLPGISSLVVGMNFALLTPLTWLGSKVSLNWRLVVFGIPTLIVAALILAIAIIQYATVWACRIALALTSPEKSARLAYALGYSLRIGAEGSLLQKVISTLAAWSGAMLSLAMSAVLWTFALPLALGALVTAIPSLLTAITWVSQLPAVSASLAWLSQWPVITNLMLLLNNVVGTVGAGLVVAFGPAITTIASAFSIQIPAMLLTVGTALGMIAIPVGAILSRGADELSNLWARWVEQKPFAAIWIKLFGSSKNSRPGGYSLLNENDSGIPLEEKTSSAPEMLPKNVHVYQPVPGKGYIVSKKVLFLKDESDQLLTRIEVTGSKAQQLYERAAANMGEVNEVSARLPVVTEYGALSEDHAVQCIMQFNL